MEEKSDHRHWWGTLTEVYYHIGYKGRTRRLRRCEECGSRFWTSELTDGRWERMKKAYIDRINELMSSLREGDRNVRT